MDPRRTLQLIQGPLTSARNHRHLLRVFVLRELRGRFAGLMGGAAWSLVSPVVTISLYLIVFSLVLRVQVTTAETGTERFGIYFLAGFLPWLLFSEGLSRSVGCLPANASLITKVVFPVELLPAGTLAAALVINSVGLLIFLAYLLFQGYGHASWLWLLLILPLQVLLTWGLACFLAALNVFVRDVGELLGLVLMIWFFVTPVIYPFSFVPPGLRAFLLWNPMAHLVGLYRGALLLHQIQLSGLALVACFSLASYALGAWFFMRAKPAFADVL